MGKLLDEGILRESGWGLVVRSARSGGYPTLAKPGWGTHFRAALKEADRRPCDPMSQNRDMGHPFFCAG